MFDDYGNYDVIYFHRPISDEEKLAELETRIVDQVKPGTILIAPYPLTMETDLADRLQRIWGKIYLPGLTAYEAAALRERAMDVGPDHPLNDAFEAEIQGFFAPAIAALRRNGYGLAPRAAMSTQPDFDETPNPKDR